MLHLHCNNLFTNSWSSALPVLKTISLLVIDEIYSRTLMSIYGAAICMTAYSCRSVESLVLCGQVYLFFLSFISGIIWGVPPVNVSCVSPKLLRT